MSHTAGATTPVSARNGPLTLYQGTEFILNGQNGGPLMRIGEVAHHAA